MLPSKQFQASLKELHPQTPMVQDPHGPHILRFICIFFLISANQPNTLILVYKQHIIKKTSWTYTTE